MSGVGLRRTGQAIYVKIADVLHDVEVQAHLFVGIC